MLCLFVVVIFGGFCVKKGQQKKRKKEEEVPKAKKGGKGGVGTDAKKREKKTFDLPGQKRDAPEEVSFLCCFENKCCGNDEYCEFDCRETP